MPPPPYPARRHALPLYGSMGCLALALILGAPLGGAQARSAAGHLVKPRTLVNLHGKKLPLLGAAKLDALVFLPPLAARGATQMLKELGECQRRLAKDPVRLLGLAPENAPAGPMEGALKQARFHAPVAVDRGGLLFTELSIAVRPTVVFLDAKHVVRAHVPYRKINFCVAIEANARFLLGQIDAAALERALNPEVRRAAQSASSPAARFVKLGDMLLKAGKAPKAQEIAKRAIAADPKLAAAHGLLGAALAAQGKCQEAKASFERALALDPKEEHAHTKDHCSAGK